ncbi:hypothetical protein TSUD_168250 [Trifolium subterraneum]|nr:hypothetical protein TSUD_168250 [Trifolium subterraneum]
MVYRVNVGQNQVPPSKDTGMFRNWDNDFALYLEKQYPQSEPVDFGDHLNFVNNTIPNYTAPEDVYLTARSYGEYVKEDYNVTWNFEVDSTFTYMAEQMADVIGWAGARMIPIHKDYAVTMFSKEVSSQIVRVNLSIKLQRVPAEYTTYSDVLLNGIEIFKISYIDEVTPVAIKRLKSGSRQGVNEFLNEIELLSQLRHIHLVSLIGYCNDDAEMILIYDFMQRGTLRENLYGSNNEPLRWNKRLEILLGAARGLHYLHTGAKHNIIHRDVKSTNILLDEKWVAKGSIGYLDPECYLRHRLTLKSDVYSFGVVLLEVLCARPPLDHSLDTKNVSLVAMFKRCYDEGVIIEEMIDPFMKDSITSECLKCYCEMVLSCLHEDGNQRMSMSEVVGTLEFMLEMVMNEEDKKFDESDVCFTNSSDDYGSHTSKLSTISTSTKE